MAKKNIKKYLPQVGGTVAVAVAMTAALSTQAFAAEEIPALELEGNIGEISTNLAAASQTMVVEDAAANAAVEESNNGIIQDNQATQEDNQAAQEDNNAAAAENAANSEGALADPGLTAPEAPHRPRHRYLC